jgi:hypothetical protein
VAIAKQIRQAKNVEVVLLRFDDLRKVDWLEDDEGRFPVAPCEATAAVISQKILDSSQSKELLLALAEQIAKPVHTGGFLCHLPVHGVRVYSGEPSGKPFDSKLIYSGTFCWVCHNFGFTYPDGAEWLDTNSKLKDIFNKLLPVPKEELERLKRKYPTEQKTAGGWPRILILLIIHKSADGGRRVTTRNRHCAGLISVENRPLGGMGQSSRNQPWMLRWKLYTVNPRDGMSAMTHRGRTRSFETPILGMPG